MDYLYKVFSHNLKCSHVSLLYMLLCPCYFSSRSLSKGTISFFIRNPTLGILKGFCYCKIYLVILIT